jgi:hypothetical protein
MSARGTDLTKRRAFGIVGHSRAVQPQPLLNADRDVRDLLGELFGDITHIALRLAVSGSLYALSIAAFVAALSYQP